MPIGLSPYQQGQRSGSYGTGMGFYGPTRQSGSYGTGMGAYGPTRQSGSYGSLPQYGGSGAGGYSRPRGARLPILPDVAEGGNLINAAGSGKATSNDPSKEASIQQEAGNDAERFAQQAAARQQGLAQEQQANDESRAKYLAADANSQGAADRDEQTAMAKSLGIDPSSSPADIAAAAAGPYTVGTNSGSVTAPSTQEDAMRNAVRMKIAGQNGQTNSAIAGAYAAGANANGATPPPVVAGRAATTSPAIPNAPAGQPTIPLSGTANTPAPYMRPIGATPYQVGGALPTAPAVAPSRTATSRSAYTAQPRRRNGTLPIPTY
jgi:hypothetical protein